VIGVLYMKKLLIAITGVYGTGKTAITRTLATILASKGYKVKVL